MAFDINIGLPFHLQERSHAAQIGSENVLKTFWSLSVRKRTYPTKCVTAQTFSNRSISDVQKTFVTISFGKRSGNVPFVNRSFPQTPLCAPPRKNVPPSCVIRRFSTPWCYTPKIWRAFQIWFGLVIFLVLWAEGDGGGEGGRLPQKKSPHLVYLGVSRIPDATLKRWRAPQIWFGLAIFLVLLGEGCGRVGGVFPGK